MGAIVDLNKILNPHYAEFHRCTDEEVHLYGGSNAGKSYSIADKFLAQAIWQKDVPRIKITCIRRTFPSLRKSVLDIIETRAKAFNFKYTINRSDWEMTCRNLLFIFCSLNNKEDFEKLKSMTDIDYIWINELLEIREPDYDELWRRLRGGSAKFSQLVADYNPEDEFHWVNDRFFVRNIGNVRKFRYTIDDNHPEYLKTEKARRERARLDRIKDHDPNQYRIYRKGEWGRLEGRIFDWDVIDLPDINFDAIFYGGDFGFSVDPAVLVKIYRKADHFWIQELLYETGLTNISLGNRMKHMGFTGEDPVAFDSAEPKSIQELYDIGINAIPAVKGKDSVRSSIDLAKSLHIHIVDGSVNLQREQKRYTWAKDKEGKSLNVPIEGNDHAIKAALYGLRTFYQPARTDIGKRAFAASGVQAIDIYGEEF